MPDRLKELQQQRALVEQQLAWLDREIAAARGDVLADTARPSITPAPATKPATFPQPIARAMTTAAADQAAEEIIARYQQDAHTLQSNVKRGCLMYFFAALGIVVLGVAVFYFFKTRG